MAVVHLAKPVKVPGRYLLLEEGLAEYLSNQIDPKKAVFSNHGYDLEIAAGQWLAAGEAIPLTTLLNRQFELRSKCIAQSYTLQPSFFQFIEASLGRKVIQRLAYAEDIKDEARLTPYLGDRFSVLESKWKKWLTKRFAAIPDHDRLGQQ